MSDYERALQQLHQVPLASFVDERKRLSAALRAAGDEAGAARIAKHPKPPTSVWVVNQLYWQARDAFDALLTAAARLRGGDRGAAPAHRDALATLRRIAVHLLRDAGYAVSDETLRRLMATLAAIAAAGDFAPDTPGALSADRDPPGFETVGLTVQPTHGELETSHSKSPSSVAERERGRSEALVRAAEERQRKQREAAERARRQAERSRLQSALRAAMAEARTRVQARALLERQLRDAENAVSAAQEQIQDLERQLASLDDVHIEPGDLGKQ
jgi:hypothetical protein